jgi:hypothetical protein
MGVNCGIMPHIFAYNSRSYNRVRNRSSSGRGDRRVTNMSAVRTWARWSSNSSRLVVPVYGKFTKKFYWVIVYRRLTERPIKWQHSNYIHDHSDYWRNDISLPRQWEFNPNNMPIIDTVRLSKMKSFQALSKISTHYAAWLFDFTHVKHARSHEGENGIKMCIIN